MSEQAQSVISAYLVQGLIGNSGTPGAPIVHFALVVTPADHKVSGRVHITQATQGGNFSGNVHGTIYTTDREHGKRLVVLAGSIHNNGTTPLELEFEATMTIDRDWTGHGGFSYGSVHVDHAAVENLTQ